MLNHINALKLLLPSHFYKVIYSKQIFCNNTNYTQIFCIRLLISYGYLQEYRGRAGWLIFRRIVRVKYSFEKNLKLILLRDYSCNRLHTKLHNFLVVKYFNLVKFLGVICLVKLKIDILRVIVINIFF